MLQYLYPTFNLSSPRLLPSKDVYSMCGGESESGRAVTDKNGKKQTNAATVLCFTEPPPPTSPDPDPFFGCVSFLFYRYSSLPCGHRLHQHRAVSEILSYSFASAE